MQRFLLLETDINLKIQPFTLRIVELKMGFLNLHVSGVVFTPFP